MKKAIYISVGIFILVVILVAADFYWMNLRGVGPVLKAPPADISQIIEDAADETGVVILPPGENNTDFPLSLPNGFAISVFAKDLEKPRVMTFDNAGNMLVSIPDEGRIVVLTDFNEDGKSDQTFTLLDNLQRPHGLAFKCNEFDICKLYVAEEHQVTEYAYSSVPLLAIKGEKLLDLPTGGRHWSRTIMFMPYPNDSTLLVSVGSSCDACDESDERRAAVIAYDIDKGSSRIYSRGLRNAVFMNIHPVTGDMWVTEMGRDGLGDDVPPDEINILSEGGHFGWPSCYGNNIMDTQFIGDKQFIRNPCQDPIETPSYIDLQAHSAPLGIAFIPEEGWPEEMWYDAIVAYHGSWNRTEPTGYKLAQFHLNADGSQTVGYSTKYGNGQIDFIDGWLTEEGALGRPVDIITQPGGIMYVSDDKAGVIYRITYQPEYPEIQTSDQIKVNSPVDNSIIDSPLSITGIARGTWYFEGDFPIELRDGNNVLLAQSFGTAQEDWMTENYVPFTATLEYASLPQTDFGTIILKKDNPSDLPEFDDKIEIPIRFR